MTADVDWAAEASSAAAANDTDVLTVVRLRD
jgi:hypothetical protein